VRLPDPGTCEIKAEFPATVAAVEEFLGEFRRQWRDKLQVAHWFAVELLLREALANAVWHGSNSDPAKVVRCVLRLSARRLVITVRDEGDGFDWRTAGRTEVGSLTPSGCGIHIYREYATSVRFNHRGNAVTLIRRF